FEVSPRLRTNYLIKQFNNRTADIRVVFFSSVEDYLISNLGEGEMRYYLPALAVMAATTFSVPAAHSVPITFTTSLSGANEVPAVVTPGAGFATVFLDPTANTLNVTFGNLTSPTDYSVTHPLLCATRHERHSRHHDTHVPRFPVRGDR